MRRNEMAEEVDQRLLTPEEMVVLHKVAVYTIPALERGGFKATADALRTLVQIIRRLTLKPSLGDGPFADYQ
jgi:hypothetical protein